MFGGSGGEQPPAGLLLEEVPARVEPFEVRAAGHEGTAARDPDEDMVEGEEDEAGDDHGDEDDARADGAFAAALGVLAGDVSDERPEEEGREGEAFLEDGVLDVLLDGEEAREEGDEELLAGVDVGELDLDVDVLDRVLEDVEVLLLVEDLGLHAVVAAGDVPDVGGDARVLEVGALLEEVEGGRPGEQGLVPGQHEGANFSRLRISRVSVSQLRVHELCTSWDPSVIISLQGLSKSGCVSRDTL